MNVGAHGHSFLSLAEAAEEICCTRRFLEKRIEDGEISVFRPSSRLVRIRRTEFDRWIESYSTTGKSHVSSRSLVNRNERPKPVGGEPLDHDEPARATRYAGDSKP